MIQSLKLTSVIRKDKNGNPFTVKTQNGVVEKLLIKTAEYGDKLLSGFANRENADWKDGQVIEVEITKKPGKDKNGNVVEYLNFSKPDKFAEVTKAIMNLNVRMTKLEERVKLLEARPDGIPVIQETDDINAELAGTPPDDSELPF